MKTIKKETFFKREVDVFLRVPPNPMPATPTEEGNNTASKKLLILFVLLLGLLGLLVSAPIPVWELVLKEIERNQPHPACPVEYWGFDVRKDVPFSKFKLSDLEFVPAMEEGEHNLTGSEILKHAPALKASLGQCDAQRLEPLLHRLPKTTVVGGKEVEIKVIVFPGTVLCDKAPLYYPGPPSCYVPELLWCGIYGWQTRIRSVNISYPEGTFFARIK